MTSTDTSADDCLVCSQPVCFRQQQPLSVESNRRSVQGYYRHLASTHSRLCEANCQPTPPQPLFSPLVPRARRPRLWPRHEPQASLCSATRHLQPFGSSARPHGGGGGKTHSIVCSCARAGRLTVRVQKHRLRQLPPTAAHRQGST